MSHLAVLQDSLEHPATPIRGFPLAVSLGFKSWGLSKSPSSSGKMKFMCKCPCSFWPRNTSAGVMLSLGSMLRHNTSSREVFGMK